MVKQENHNSAEANEEENVVSSNEETINESMKAMAENGNGENENTTSANSNDDGSSDINEEDEEQDSMKKKLSAKEKEIENLSIEVETLKDTMLRRQADFENYKKRHHKMQIEQKKLAVKDLALDIIHINDDLLRALEASSHIQKDQSFEEAHSSFVEGVTMISNRIEDALKKYNVVEIDSLNKEFDPNFNEAVEIEMDEGVNIDTVTKVYQKGFRIDDIVLRSSKVRVAKPMKQSAAPQDAAEDKEKDSADTMKDTPSDDGDDQIQSNAG